MSSLRLVLLSLALPLALASCTPPVTRCGPANCSTGCCDVNGLCQTGASIAACGASGFECRTCTTGQVCTNGQCTGGTGGGSGFGGGNVGGGNVGGGPSGGGSGGGGADAGVVDPPMCAAGFTLCGIACTNTRSDLGNCGACGRACAESQYCNNGACTTLPTNCTTIGCPTNFYCDATRNQCVFGCQSNSNCVPSQTCDLSRNVCTCPPNTTFCGGSCVPPGVPTACGQRCLSCGGGPFSIPSCTNGACDFTCQPGYHRCGNRCVSNFDALTCGTRCDACVAPANSTPICDGTDCGFVCSTGYHSCNGACVSNFDVATCGNSCSPCTPPANAVAVCTTGTACEFSCNPGFVRCGAQCVQESAQACGATCQTCRPPAGATNPQCVSGQCQYTCATGFHQCGSACVSDTSTASCGASCTPCPAPIGGIATCDGTSCGVQCNPGSHECNGQCVTNFSVNSCGTRCTPCPSGPVGSGTTVTCDGANCGLRCASTATPNYCGNVCVADSITSCGPSCQTCTPPANASATCLGGTCDFTCSSGFHRCGNQCVLDDSVDACGTSCSPCPQGPPNTTRTCTRPSPTAQYACGWTCGAGTNRCPAGGNQCVPADYPQGCGLSCGLCPAANSLERGVCTASNGTCGTDCINRCSNTCVNVQTSAAHCGACGVACGGSDRCSQGECRALCSSGIGLSGLLPALTLTSFATTFPFLVLDVNGDGRADLVTVEPSGSSSSVNVRFGLANAAGTGPSGLFSSAVSTQVLLSFFTPTRLIAGDLTGDGRPELVLWNTTSTTAPVLRNLGTGTFTSYPITASFPVGTFTITSATIGEFTGAAPNDLLFTFNTASGTQSSALWPGLSGSVGNPLASTGVAGGLGIGTPSNVRAAAINTDAFSDVVTTAASNAMYLFPGTGNGAAPINSGGAVLAQLPGVEAFTAGAAGAPFPLDVADVTADGVPDVVVPISNGGVNGVRVYPLTSALAFGTSTLLAVPGVPRAIVTADVNDDGRRDVIVASTDVRVFLSQAGGTFSAAQVLGVTFSATWFESLAAADVTGDAKPDLFVPVGSSLLTVVNDGSGVFASVQGTNVGNASRIVAGDLNGDGLSDVATVTAGSASASGTNIRLVDITTTSTSITGRVEVFNNGAWGTVCSPSFSTIYEGAVLCRSLGLGACTGSTFSPSPTTPPGISAFFCNSGGEAAWSACGFTAPSTCTNSSDRSITCSLPTGTTFNTATVTQVLLATSGGGFTPGASFSTRGEALAIGALNTDSADDLVVGALAAADGGPAPDAGVTVPAVQVRFGGSSGTLSGPVALLPTAQPAFALVAEVSGDTLADVIVATSSTIEVFRNLGSNTFATGVVVSTTGANSVAATDVNLDGRRDLLTLNATSGTVQVLLNVALPNTVGFVAGTSVFVSGSTNFAIKAAELNGDGKPDFVVGRSIYTGNGSGTFTLFTSFLPIQPPRQVIVDLDNDGLLDLVAAGAGSSVLSIASGLSGSFSSTPVTFTSGATVEDVAVARLNGDAQRDLILLQGVAGNRFVVGVTGVCR